MFNIHTKDNIIYPVIIVLLYFTDTFQIQGYSTKEEL
jgi:hypothetical protein